MENRNIFLTEIFNKIDLLLKKELESYNGSKFIKIKFDINKSILSHIKERYKDFSDISIDDLSTGDNYNYQTETFLIFKIYE